VDPNECNLQLEPMAPKKDDKPMTLKKLIMEEKDLKLTSSRNKGRPPPPAGVQKGGSDTEMGGGPAALAIPTGARHPAAIQGCMSLCNYDRHHDAG